MRIVRELFGNLQKRLVLIYMAIIVCIGAVFFTGSIFAYKQTYYNNTIDHINDLTTQVTANLQSSIREADSLTFAILSNAVVQQRLKQVNRKTADASTLLGAKKDIWQLLVSLTPLNDVFISLSLFSDSGIDYTVQKITGAALDYCYDKDEIYKGNGSLLWGLTRQNGHICAARAILSTETMKPIGYISIVYDRENFEDIVQGISKSYSAGTYVVDEAGNVVISNNGKNARLTLPEGFDRPGTRDVKYDGENMVLFTGERMKNGWRLVSLVPVEYFRSQTLKFMTIILTVTLTTVVIGLFVNSRVTRFVTKPMRDIVLSMERFGDGDLSSRSRVASNDEMGKIAGGFNGMAEKIEMLIEKVYKMEISNKQAEISMLKTQINPHFLYNTLDTINWMAVLRGCKDISDIAVSLASFLRSTLVGKDFVTLDEELSIVRNYLFIQSFRFSDKINIIYNIDDRALTYSVPSFILQPLVENAIIHGIEPKETPGTLTVSAELKDGLIDICLDDDGVGISPEAMERLNSNCEPDDSKNDNIGIKNVRRRLTLYYGDDAFFSIDSKNGAGTRVRMVFPSNARAGNKLKERQQ